MESTAGRALGPAVAICMLLLLWTGVNGVETISFALADAMTPPEPGGWDVDVVVDSDRELREAICLLQGALVDDGNPSACSTPGSVSPRVRVVLVAHLSLGGSPLPPIHGWLQIQGQCGAKATDPCEIHAVGAKCSLCPTPIESGVGSTAVCEDCKAGPDFTETRPLLITEASKLWLKNISLRGCRTKSNGGCIMLAPGDSGGWAPEKAANQQGGALTFLRAEDVTISRGYAQGEGGALAIFRGGLASLARCTFEDNFSATDGVQLKAGGESSHDGVVNNFAALLLTDPDPNTVKVKVTTVLGGATNDNTNYIKGLLFVSFSSEPSLPPGPSPSLRPPPLWMPGLLPTVPDGDAPSSTTPPAVVIVVADRPLWVYLLIAGGALLVLFAAAACCLLFCRFNTQRDADDQDSENDRDHLMAAKRGQEAHTTWGRPDGHTVVSVGMPGVLEAKASIHEPKAVDPRPVSSPAEWQSKEQERKVHDFLLLSDGLRPTDASQRSGRQVLEPLPGHSPLGAITPPESPEERRAILDDIIHPKPRPFSGVKKPRPASALSQVASNPLRPPSSQPEVTGCAIAVWKPSPMAVGMDSRPGTSQGSRRTSRPGTAVGSWGSPGPSAFATPGTSRPATAVGQQQGSARVTRKPRNSETSPETKRTDSAGGRPKPAWRYLVEAPKTPKELPGPAGPRPHLIGSPGNSLADSDRARLTQRLDLQQESGRTLGAD